MFNDKQLQILNQEIDSSRVKTRNKGNISLSYLEGFDVIETANRIFGFGNWEYSISSLEMVSQEVNQNQNNVVCYKAVIKIVVHNENHTLTVSREDVGFGTGISKTLADSHEGGAKEAVTDGIKRSLKSYGSQMGLSLYDKSKNHNNNNQQHNNTQNYSQTQNNTNQQNYQPPQNQSNQQPYQNQQDFSQLTNLGLTVMQQGENLIVVGDNVFENKEIIKQNGFRWDGTSKTWYMQLRQAA
jgi:DNA repair and recombination protein RAD52